MISILAIDLGTKTGWAQGALGSPDNFSCGAVKLATAAEVTANGKARLDRTLDPRIVRLHAWLDRRYVTVPFDWLLFEDVEFASSRMQAHLWASFRTTLWLFAAQRAIKTECCPTGTLKKFATGSGGADKAQMAVGLTRQQPKRFSFDKPGSFVVKDAISGIYLNDDVVDAVHLLKWGFHTLKNYEQRSSATKP